MTVAAEGATVAAADIARIARVGRAAVSNWRRRFPDFPEPVGGSAASPLFSLAEVEAWFSRHGRPFRVRPGDRVWQWIRGAVDELRTGDLVGCIGAFLVFRGRDQRRWRKLSADTDEVLAVTLAEAIADTVPEIPALPERLDPEWPPIVRAVAELADDRDPAELFDFFLERYTETHARRLPTTPEPVAELMVRLAEASAGDVLDPACGTGTLLWAARAAGASALYGQDTNPTAARLAASRLLLRGAPATIRLGDSLRQDALVGTSAGAVVCSPPVSERSWGYEELAGDPRWEHGLPPRGEPELAWVQHCLAHLRPGGHAALMMPAAAASRRSGRRIRSNLLRSGVLRAVVTLPGGVTPGAPPDLWVLRRPATGDTPPSHLLVVQCKADLSVVEPAWQSFRSNQERNPPGPSRTVRIIDLLDEEVDVSPPRHLADLQERRKPAEFLKLRDRLRPLSEGLAGTLPDLVVPAEPGPLPMTTVGDLAKAGVVALHQAPLRMRTDEGDRPVLTVRDVRRGRPPSGCTDDEPGMVALEPGDVIVPLTARDAVVRVVADEVAVLGPQLLLFRPDPQRLDPHFLAGFLRLAGMSAQGRAVTSLSKLDTRRTAIPLLPSEAQAEYSAAFQRLEAFESAVRETQALAEDLVRLGYAGLAEGTLRPRGEAE